MTAIAVIAAFALLFALYGLVRRGRGCASDCGACRRPCSLLESDDA